MCFMKPYERSQWTLQQSALKPIISRNFNNGRESFSKRKGLMLSLTN